MKRVTLVPLAISLGLILAVALPAAASSGANFRGRWHGTDVDGSNMQLWITPSGWSGHRVLNLRGTDDDTVETWCGGHARMEGFGVPQDENTLATSIAWWCLDPAENILFPLPVTFTYDSSTDTISDEFGVVFYRGG